MHLKRLKSERLKKKQKLLMNWFAIKLLIKLQVSRISPQDSCETVESETEVVRFDRKIPTEKFPNILRDIKHGQNIFFIRILTCFIYHRTFRNVICDISIANYQHQNYIN